MVRKRHAGSATVRETHTSSPIDFGAPTDQLYGSQMDLEPATVLDIGQGSITEGAIVPGGLDASVVLMEGTIASASFAAGIRPVAIVAVLPTLPDTDYPEFSYAVLTTDERLYKNIGEVWVLGVDGADIVSNSITAGQIAAGAVSTSELAVGAKLVGEVANDNTGTPGVFIDSSGILIRDGNLTIEDEFGQTTLEASGFSGSWEDQATTGIRNGAFFGNGTASGVTGRTSAIPYWTAAVASGATIDAVPGVVELNVNAAGEIASVTSDPIRARSGQWYQIAITGANGYGVGDILDVNVTVDYLDKDLTDQGGFGASTMEFEGDSPTAPREVRLTEPFMIPVFGISDNILARYLTIKVEVSYNAGDPFAGSAGFLLHEVALVELPSGEGSTFPTIDRPPRTFERFFDHSSQAEWFYNGVEWLQPGFSGFAPSAFCIGYSGAQAYTSATSLAAVAAGLGGARAIPLVVTAPMRARTVYLWNTDTASARACETRLYQEDDFGVLWEVAGSDATFSFTPTVASRRSAVMSGAPVRLKPGIVWLVIRNTSASQTFGLGFTAAAAGTLDPFSNFLSTTAALGSTIDVTGWTESSAILGSCFIGGDIMGSTSIGGVV